MWRSTLPMAVFGVTALGAARYCCGCSTRDAKAAEPPAASMVTLKIEGMTCGGCADTVEKTLRGLDGVLAADVDFAAKTAVVRYDPAKVTPDRMARAFDGSHYRATVVLPSRP